MNKSKPSSPEITVLLIRHAHSTMAGRFCGHSDPPLSDTGQKQLCQIAEHLERWPIAKVYTSDLKRAHATAAAIAARRSVPLVVRAGLREINFGEWEGRSWEEIEATASAAATSWLNHYPRRAAPGGQSLKQYRLQVEAELRGILKELDQDRIAIVTHAGFIRAALVNILNIAEGSMHRVEIDYGGVTVLHYTQLSWRVEGINLCSLPSPPA